MSPEELAREQERQDLVREVPELRARMMDEFVNGMGLSPRWSASVPAAPADDIAVRTFAGAFVGALGGVYFTALEPPVDYIRLFDETLEQFELGFTF